MTITRKKWTLEDDKNLIELKSQGYRNKDIAKIIDRTESSISSRLVLLSNDDEKPIKVDKRGPRYNQNEIAYIVLNHKKFKVHEIAKNLGRSHGSIAGTISRLKKEGLIITDNEPKQMELISPQIKQEIKPPIIKTDQELKDQIKGLKSDYRWLASLCVINFVGVIIIALINL